MKKEMKSFLLRMAVVLLVLGAICFVGAYGAPKAPVLRVAAKEQTPMRVA